MFGQNCSSGFVEEIQNNFLLKKKKEVIFAHPAKKSSKLQISLNNLKKIIYNLTCKQLTV